MNNWILSDDDCSQYVRKVRAGHYELYQIQEHYPFSGDTYAVVHDYIVLADYDDEDILDYIEPYGYKSICTMYEDYGPVAGQIIAECIFETKATDGTINVLVTGTEKYCRFYLVGLLREERDSYHE